MKTGECRFDFVARARRGSLSPAERRTFETHLATCDACQFDALVAHDFDDMRDPELDEGKQIQRLVVVAEKWARGPERRVGLRSFRRHKSLFLLAACVVLVGGFASAALDSRVRGRSSIVFRATAWLGISRSADDRASEIPAEFPSSPWEEPLQEMEMPPALALRETEAPLPRGTRDTPRPFPTKAAEVFRAANDARRRGDADKAFALYRILQETYAGMPETNLSYEILGSMLLDRGQPRAALEQFDRYLSGPRDHLRAEALYGRARALHDLADVDGERRAWMRVLSEFPNSPYAAAARRGLEALPAR